MSIGAPSARVRCADRVVSGPLVAISGLICGLAAAFTLAVAGGCDGGDVTQVASANTSDDASVAGRPWEFDANALPASAVLDLIELPAPLMAEARRAATEAELDAVLRSALSERPRAHGLKIGAANLARGIMEGRLRLGAHPPVEYSLPVDWTTDPFGANWYAQFHSLRFVSSLVAEYDKRGDEACMERAEHLVFDWMRQNPPTGDSSRRAWRPEQVATRLMVLAHFYDAWRTIPEGQMRHEVGLARLLLCIDQHASLLIEDDARGYEVRRSRALLAAAFAAPEMLAHRKWFEHAIDQLATYHARDAVTSEGVSVGNSVAGHFFVVSNLARILELLAANGHEEPAELRDLLDRMANFAAHVLLPDGRMPALGSGTSQNIKGSHVRRFARRHPPLRYSMTGGSKGRPPQQIDGCFAASGYAIFRDSWGDSTKPLPQRTYAAFVATYHLPRPFAHKQDDELSFMLCAGGREWIMDPGAYSHTPSDPQRRYAMSVDGHNAYSCSDLSYPPRGAVSLDERLAWMEPIVSRPELAMARAYNRRFPDTTITRTIVYLRALNVFVLLDEMDSAAGEGWRGLLHLAPDLDVHASGLGATATAPDTPFVLEILADDGGATGRVDMVKGQTNPLQGWMTTGWRQAEPCPTLIFDRPGRRWKAATVIRLRERDALPLHDVRLEVTEGGTVVRFHIGEDGREVHIDAAPELAGSCRPIQS